jgi:hypothetical protein
MYALTLSCGFSATICAGASAQGVGPRPGSRVGPGFPPSSLPATPPTTAPQPVPAPPQVTPLTATPTQPGTLTRAHRAAVTYNSGLVSINASNSSLNQILREISKQTGMKITGGVRDERVFGHYGPATLSDILITLIDGTGTNLVLRQTASNTPVELILTPRNGGATPPNPNAPGFDDGVDDDDRDTRRETQRATPPPATVQPVAVTQPARATGPPSIPPPANNVNGSPSNTSPTASTLPVTNSVPTDSLPTPSTTPSANGIVDAPNPPDPGTVNPTPGSPNAVKTPEDIYKQLQQLRQQQQQQQTPATTTPPATTPQ